MPTRYTVLNGFIGPPTKYRMPVSSRLSTSSEPPMTTRLGSGERSWNASTAFVAARAARSVAIGPDRHVHAPERAGGEHREGQRHDRHPAQAHEPRQHDERGAGGRGGHGGAWHLSRLSRHLARTHYRRVASAAGTVTRAVFTVPCRHATITSAPARAIIGMPVARPLDAVATVRAAWRPRAGHGPHADVADAVGRLFEPGDERATILEQQRRRASPRACRRRRRWAPKTWHRHRSRTRSSRALRCPAAVNHATATSRPRAATAGPFVGQPPIFQPSRCTGAGAVHVPFTRRTIEMSRISPASWSR